MFTCWSKYQFMEDASDMTLNMFSFTSTFHCIVTYLSSESHPIQLSSFTYLYLTYQMERGTNVAWIKGYGTHHSGTNNSQPMVLDTTNYD
jgi:hypothetical protein